MRVALSTMLVLVLSACGPMVERVTLGVADHPDALTTAAGDNLFTLTVTDAATLDLPIADVLVSANLPGQTATAVNFTHNDANGNGKIDSGESLSCKEPPVNLFDGTAVGKTVSVSLAVRKSGNSFLTSVGTVTWTPTN